MEITTRELRELGAWKQFVEEFHVRFGEQAELAELFAWLQEASRTDFEAMLLSRTVEFTRKAVTHGANVHAGDDYPLQLAAEEGNFEMVKFLIWLGCDPHASEGNALFLAASAGHITMVMYLQDEKNVRIKDASLLQAIRNAIAGGHDGIVDLLRRSHST